MCENGTIQTVEDKENEAEEPESTVAGEKALAVLFADKKNGYNNDGNKEPAQRFESAAVGIGNERGDQDAAGKHQRHLNGVGAAFRRLNHGVIVNGKDDAVGNAHDNDLPIPMERQREERKAECCQRGYKSADHRKNRRSRFGIARISLGIELAEKGLSRVN